MPRERRLRLSPTGRLLVTTGLAVSAFALGAVPALADSTPLPPPPADPSASAVVAPQAPDVSQAVSPVAAAQAGPQNVNVSIRVDSPGDNGPVAQTVAATAGAVADAAQAGSTSLLPAQGAAQTAATPAAQGARQDAATAQAAPAPSSATQVAPTNLDVSVRIGSPGNDASVTQTIVAAAAATSGAQTQYQPAPDQYQPAAEPQPASTPLVMPPTTDAPASPAPPAPTPPVLPASWTWNWTWTCGGTTDAGTTRHVDTGVTGWIWNWNLDTLCVTPVPPRPPIQFVNPPAIVPPAIPSIGPAPGPAGLLTGDTVQPAAAPAPAGAETSVAAADSTAVPAVESQPVASDQSMLPATSIVPSIVDVLSLPRPPWAAAASPRPTSLAVSPTLAVDDAAALERNDPARQADAPRGPHRPSPKRAPENPIPLDLAFAPTAAGAAGSGGSGGGGGVVVALAVWLFVQMPGFAGRRFALQRRRPRSRVDDREARPG